MQETKEPDLKPDPESAPNAEPDAPQSGVFDAQIHPSSDERRRAPHWSLVVAALILFAFFLFLSLDHLTPLILALAIMFLLYPNRHTRALRPFIALVAIVIVGGIWMRFQTLITPFLVAFIIAFAIDPLVELLMKTRMPRPLVILLIVLAIFGALTGFGIMIIPQLAIEVGELANKVPGWVENARYWGEHSFMPWLEKRNLPTAEAIADIRSRSPEILRNVLGEFADWSSAALTGVVGLLTGILNLILIPIFTVYFLKEFKRIRGSVYELTPRRNQPFALEAYHAVNRVLTGYVRGQLLVVTFLATWIGFGLWLVADIPFALLLGIITGLANLIPYLGTSTAGLFVLIIASTQPDPWISIFKALAVFLSGQALENFYITPRVVGNRVGLHPLMIIFVVFWFASMFGLVGMLVAIPVTAAGKDVFNIWRKHRKMARN